MKKLLIPMLLALALLFAACDNTTDTTEATVTETGAAEEVTEPTEVDTEFTREELAQFNGKDGQPAYVAVDGVVYDVTQSGAWADGQHNGFEAGQDLTEALANEAPHDDSNLDGFPVVGNLVD